MTNAVRRLAGKGHPGFPVSIYYAFKQSETKGEIGASSTGWETFLDAVIRSGFAITGTWPMRTEYTGNLKRGTNALASSIVLVCRQRPANAPLATRREFVASLRDELPAALAHLQAGNIAPVDLAQAAIGPGMAVFTRYAKVLDAEGEPVLCACCGRTSWRTIGTRRPMPGSPCGKRCTTSCACWNRAARPEPIGITIKFRESGGRLATYVLRESLAGSLESRGIKYVFSGRELGGRSDDPVCYEDGRVRFNLHPAGDLFRSAEPREKLVAEAIEIQAKRIAFVNKKLVSTFGESNR